VSASPITGLDLWDRTRSFFADKQKAAIRLFQDVGRNSVKCFDVPNYQGLVNVPVHPPGLADKWTHLYVACSGDESSRCDWLAVVPYRVDTSGTAGHKVCDLDPVLLVLDSDTGTPHDSGVVAYHRDFPGRTTALPGYETLSKEQTVSTVRSNLTSNMHALGNAPREVLNALHYMVNQYRPILKVD
jgi:hypothetical protein